ncbi:hypothetical protein BS78_K217700 [Paspalum vaginatum]|uniref:Uncharacterized protein n=1 Tax=Paspalum vaginatum TaxID=158149 RepID=A0A9W8CF49_9POAL|nr:hypothetical protein BS78_K217700 [Paspalum vaginatum]
MLCSIVTVFLSLHTVPPSSFRSPQHAAGSCAWWRRPSIQTERAATVTLSAGERRLRAAVGGARFQRPSRVFGQPTAVNSCYKWDGDEKMDLPVVKITKLPYLLIIKHVLNMF